MNRFKITAILICYRYLNFSEAPEKSDVVVLFVGPDQDQRLKEAHQLKYEGYADTLIIPAYQQVFVMSEGQIVKAPGSRLRPFPLNAYPDYYENTHVEALLAGKMTEELGFRFAIMVSAPYHMRRIKIISSRVFDPEKFQIQYIGSRYLQPGSLVSVFTPKNLKLTIVEAAKIVSFLAYKNVV